MWPYLMTSATTGVPLELADGRKALIGTQRPESGGDQSGQWKRMAMSCDNTGQTARPVLRGLLLILIVALPT